MTDKYDPFVIILRRTNINEEIAEERQSQDDQWGGPEHDDEHNMCDWFEFVRGQLLERDEWRSASGPDVRERLIKIAALALAGIESLDRKSS